MKKSDLVNMVMFVPQAVELTTSAIALLDRVVWRANEQGKLLKPNNSIISFADCADMIRMPRSTWRRAVRDLRKAGIVYKNKDGGGGLILSRVTELYALAQLTWRKNKNEACSDNEGEGFKLDPQGFKSDPQGFKLDPQ